MSEIVFATEREQFRGGTTAFVVAPAASLADGSAFELARSGSSSNHDHMLAAAAALAAKAGGGSVSGSSASTLVVGGDGDATELVLVPLPSDGSRALASLCRQPSAVCRSRLFRQPSAVCRSRLTRARNAGYYSPTNSMAITGGLSSGGLTGSASPTVLIVLRELDDIGPAAMAVARACPTYSRKTSDSALQKVTVGFVTAAEPGTLITDATALSACALLAESVRTAADIAETPAEDMSTADVEARARELLDGVPNVGKSAAFPTLSCRFV